MRNENFNIYIGTQ